jgi:hypothetical protein
VGYVYVGFGSVFPGDPSPKFHDQEIMLVALGIDRSVKVVRLPTHAVSALKLATGNWLTDTVFTMVSGQLLILLMISVTVKGPLDVKEWAGFCNGDVLLPPDTGSPKFQFQEMIGPPPFNCD